MSTDHFGKLLTQGLKSIAALEKIDLTDLQHELGHAIGVSVWTIYKWRKGASIPSDDRTIEMLARACVGRGRMDRHWLADFLKLTVYSDKQALIRELCPDDQGTFSVTHNLPRRQHMKLIGRDEEIGEMKRFLSPQHRVGVICISGGGGVGKTALALEVAHHYKDGIGLAAEERFRAIIWVTAKNAELLPAGQVERHPTFTDLDGVYRAISELLDIPAVFRTATHAERNIIIMRFLAEHRVLLVLDNLESVDDQELMVFLRDLPAPSKAIVTTRHRIDVALPIHLHALDEATAHELVHLECQRHSLQMADGQARALLQRTGGLPLAIIRTIGRMAWRGSSIETEIQQLQDPANQIYDFCFGKTIELIRPGTAHQLLMTLAVFAESVRREALGFVAGFGDDFFQRDEALSDLEVLSLCNKDSDFFGLEPLTRTQALVELHANPDFEAAARERWTTWYLNFTAQFGGPDGQEMHLRYDNLEEDWDNVLAVIDWCMTPARYEQAVSLWQSVRDFMHIYGYWVDRLKLLDWLIAEAEGRDELQVALQAMYDKAFTLTLTGPSTRVEEASLLLQRCWSLRACASHALQARITALTASICIRQQNYGEAHRWLDRGEALLKEANLDPLALARERTSLLYDRGENWLSMGDLANAQQVFKEMLHQAQISNWQRSVAHAQNWLAYTAILQGNYDLSEQYLQMGWPIVNRIKEKRVNAAYRRTFAHYYRAVGNPTEAFHWAESALDCFERLGMLAARNEMQTLIDNLNAH